MAWQRFRGSAGETLDSSKAVRCSRRWCQGIYIYILMFVASVHLNMTSIAVATHLYEGSLIVAPTKWRLYFQLRRFYHEEGLMDRRIERTHSIHKAVSGSCHVQADAVLTDPLTWSRDRGHEQASHTVLPIFSTGESSQRCAENAWKGRKSLFWCVCDPCDKGSLKMF
jgi:hypothetical protein